MAVPDLSEQVLDRNAHVLEPEPRSSASRWGATSRIREILERLCDHALFVAQVLRRYDLFGVGLVNEEAGTEVSCL